LLEFREVEIQLARYAQEREIVALPSQPQNLRALRAEVHVNRRTAAAGPTDLDDFSMDGGRHDKQRFWVAGSTFQVPGSASRFLNPESGTLEPGT